MTGWLQVPLWAQFRSGLRDVLSVGAVLGQDAAACISWMRVCSANTRAEASARAALGNVSIQARAVHKIKDHTIDVRARVRPCPILSVDLFRIGVKSPSNRSLMEPGTLSHITQRLTPLKRRSVQQARTVAA